MKHNPELFESMPVPKAVAKLAVPSIVSMLVVFIYNIADTFFVGQTGDPIQVAAVTIATPVFLLFMAVGTLLGIGGTSVLSKALGEKRIEYVKHVSSFCFYASIAFGIILMILFWLFMPSIMKLIGTSPETLSFATDYMNYISLSAPFVILSQAFSNIIRAEGKPNQAMVGMMAGTILNIILDPVMIFTFHMGVTGAAVATVIGNIVSALIYLHYLLTQETILSIRPKDFKMNDHIFTGIFAIGIPVSLNGILMSVSTIILNNLLAAYGDLELAAMGIAIRASLLLILLQLGIGQGIQPILGYNYGAGNMVRFKNVLKFSFVMSIAIGILLTVIYVSTTRLIISAFIDNPDVITSGVYILRALLISTPVVGVLFICINALQGMGKALPSLLMTLTRQGLFFTPMVFILNKVFGLKGIVFTQPITDILSIIMAFTVLTAVLKKHEKHRVSLDCS